MMGRFTPIFPPASHGLTWQTRRNNPDDDVVRGLSMGVVKDDDSKITWDSQAMQEDQP